MGLDDSPFTGWTGPIELIEDPLFIAGRNPRHSKNLPYALKN
jgi:hypothetical protein